MTIAEQVLSEAYQIEPGDTIDLQLAITLHPSKPRIIAAMEAYANLKLKEAELFTKSQVQALLTRQLEIAAEEAKAKVVKEPYVGHLWGVDKSSIINCKRVKL